MPEEFELFLRMSIAWYLSTTNLERHAAIPVARGWGRAALRTDTYFSFSSVRVPRSEESC